MRHHKGHEGRETPGESGDGARLALLNAACRVIAEGGFEGLRVRQVAALAGLNHATLHYYFPQKEDLIRGVVEHCVSDLAAVQRAGRRRVTATPRDRLRAHFAAILRQARGRPELFAVLCELDARARRDPVVRRVVAEADRGWHGYVSGILRDGQAAGAVRPDLDPDAAGDVVMAFFKGLPLLHRGIRAERAVRELERWLVEEGSPPEKPKRRDR